MNLRQYMQQSYEAEKRLAEMTKRITEAAQRAGDTVTLIQDEIVVETKEDKAQ